jgi:hypothetical protein
MPHKSPSNDQIRTELIKSGGGTLLSAIHKVIAYVWNSEELPYNFPIEFYLKQADDS